MGVDRSVYPHMCITQPYPPPPLNSNRRTRGGVLEYEVKFWGMHERDNKYMTKAELEGMVRVCSYVSTCVFVCEGLLGRATVSGMGRGREEGMLLLLSSSP